MRSLRPGERFIQDKILRPWYGCQNMECDDPPMTGCGGFGETRYYHVSDDQMKLWNHRCYVTLIESDDGKLAGIVCKQRAYEAKRAQLILGKPIKIQIV